MRYVLRESITGFIRNKVNGMAIIITLWVSLTLFGLGLASTFQVNRIKGEWYDKIEISIFMCVKDSEGANCTPGEDATDAQRQDVKNVLEHDPLVQKVIYEDKAQAFAGFQKAYENSPVLETVKLEDMQDSFRIKLVNPEEYKGVVERVKDLPGVQTVQDLRPILDPLFNVLAVAKWLAMLASGMLLLAAIIQISTTIKITVISRHRELGIMRLVGASNMAIMLPFVLEALFCGILGAGLAIGTLVVGYKLGIIDQAEKLLAGTPWITWSEVAIVCGSCLAMSLVLVILPTIFSARRVLKV